MKEDMEQIALLGISDKVFFYDDIDRIEICQKDAI